MKAKVERSMLARQVNSSATQTDASSHSLAYDPDPHNIYYNVFLGYLVTHVTYVCLFLLCDE